MRSSEETYLSYVSPLLLRRLQLPEPVVLAEVERFAGAVAMIDVERFSVFAERMSSRGNEGVEQLATRINETFSLIVAAIERYGGIAHSFPGDSVIALWTADERTCEEAALLAAQCCLELVRTHPDGELPLKAGLAVGDMSIVHVGGVEGRRQLLLSGQVLEGMGRAEERSSRGRLIVTDSARRMLDPHATAAACSEGFFEITSFPSTLPAGAPARACPGLRPGTMEAARAYLPSALLRELDAGHGSWLGEFREVTIVFVQILTGDDPHHPEHEGFAYVQRSFREVQRALYRYGGDITRFAHDDKGLTVLAAFGLPPASSEDSSERAVTAALQIEREAPAHRFHCRIGIATGRVFCGTLGAPARREYSIVGSTPNLAMRLLQSIDSGVL